MNVGEETPWGTATGSGTFIYGTNDTLTATADEGYIFAGWNDLNTDNPRVITVSRDSNFTAYFIREEVEIPVNDTTMGSVTVSSTGQISATTPIVITATPEPHYHFVSWSDGNTDNPRILLPIEAVGLTAIFAIDQHTIIVQSADETMGTVSIDGDTFDYGTEITFSADAFAGYVFLSWSDGNTDNPRTIIVEQDSSFTAYFQSVDGINDVTLPNVNIYSYDNHIFVANAEGCSIEIFDMSGRLIVRESIISQSLRQYTILAPGVYLVKVGNMVKKVSIITK